MRILQVTSFFKPLWESGGVARVSYEISKRLAAQGHQVTVYTTNRSLYETNLETNRVQRLEGMSVYYFRNLRKYFPRKTLPPVPYYMPFIAMKEIKQFDIIHIHGYRNLLALCIHHYAKKYGIPYVLQAHGSLPRVMTKQRLKWIFDVLFGYRLLRDASKVIALSKIEAGQYRGMGVPDEKIAIVPNGIDLSEYADLPSKGEFKKKYHIPEDKKIILYVGRIHMAKGIGFLLKAFAYLINKKCNDVLLVVVGPDDGYLHEVKSLSVSLDVSNSVLFTGLISNKDKISAYVDSSICCYLNPNEPFGLVSIEAAVSKLPVVVSDGTPMSEIVNRGGFGFSITYGDALSLVKTMETVLKDEKLANEMGKSGREYVFENFGWDTIIDKYEMLYGDISART